MRYSIDSGVDSQTKDKLIGAAIAVVGLMLFTVPLVGRLQSQDTPTAVLSGQTDKNSEEQDKAASPTARSAENQENPQRSAGSAHQSSPGAASTAQAGNGGGSQAGGQGSGQTGIGGTSPTSQAAPGGTAPTTYSPSPAPGRGGYVSAPSTSTAPAPQPSPSPAPSTSTAPSSGTGDCLCQTVNDTLPNLTENPLAPVQGLSETAPTVDNGLL